MNTRKDDMEIPFHVERLQREFISRFRVCGYIQLSARLNLTMLNMEIDIEPLNDTLTLFIVPYTVPQSFANFSHYFSLQRIMNTFHQMS